jgi:glycosyltransferase involved in cell wall biosynthesis
MKQFMGAADICLATLQNIPMFKTTYPNKVFDYMAAGRPTVLGIDGVIREVIEAAEGGLFVQPGDAKALAEAVRRLAAEPGLRKQQGTKARAYVLQHFDRRQQAAQFVALLEGFKRTAG